MERSRRGDGHENTAQSLPPVGKLDQHLTTEPPVPEALERSRLSETPTLPGYLTLEIDLNALGDMAPWRLSHNATSDEPPGKA